MSLVTLLATLALVHIAALISPGPDFALMLRGAVSGGRRYAMTLALGLASAILLHTVTVVFAAALLQQLLPSLMLWLPWCAAIWLMYLGIHCVHVARQPISHADAVIPAMSAQRGWWTGFTTNALNPKAYVYFFSIIAGMLPTQSTLWFKLLLVLLFFLLAFGWFAFLGWMLNVPRLRNQLQQRQPLISGISGMVLFVFSALLLWQGFQRILGGSVTM